MTTLLFARHGQASFGQRNYDKLSHRGITQSKLLGEQYARSGRQIDAVVTGTLSRQQDTATHFLNAYVSEFPTPLDAIEPSIIEAFDEFNHNDVFMKLKPEFATQAGIITEISKAPVPKVRLAELFNEAMLRWHSGEHDGDYIESWTQFNQRVQQGLQQVITQAEQSQAKTVLVVTSGGVIAAITAKLLNQGSQMAYRINRSLINTGVTSITVTTDKTRLLSLNEHSHLYRDGEILMTWQ